MNGSVGWNLTTFCINALEYVCKQIGAPMDIANSIDSQPVR
jgi:hypothetical protein